MARAKESDKIAGREVSEDTDYPCNDLGKLYDTLSAREPKQFERWWVNGRPAPIEFEIGDAAGGDRTVLLHGHHNWLTILLIFAEKTFLQA